MTDDAPDVTAVDADEPGVDLDHASSLDQASALASPEPVRPDPFERAQRRWLAEDPPVLLDVPTRDLPLPFRDLTDPQLAIPAGVFFRPVLPSVSARSGLALTATGVLWFAALVLFFLTFTTELDAWRLPAIGAVVVLGALTWRFWREPGGVIEARARADVGTWREGRYLTSSAWLSVRGETATLLPRHRIVATRERAGLDERGEETRRGEVVVLDGTRQRAITLAGGHPTARSAVTDDLDDVDEIGVWLDDEQWLRQFRDQWTVAVHDVDSFDALSAVLSEPPFALDEAYRFEEHVLLHEPFDVGERRRWTLLGARDGGWYRRGSVRLDGDELDVAVALRGALVDGELSPAVRDRDEDLTSRLLTPEEHGLSALGARRAHRDSPAVVHAPNAAGAAPIVLPEPVTQDADGDATD